LLSPLLCCSLGLVLDQRAPAKSLSPSKPMPRKQDGYI